MTNNILAETVLKMKRKKILIEILAFTFDVSVTGDEMWHEIEVEDLGRK